MKSKRISCPVCNDDQPCFLLHSDAPVLACQICSHEFTDISAINHERYGPEYYEITHKKWFENPDINLFKKLHKLFPLFTKSILDVGCGNGNFLRYLADNSLSIERLLGVDLRYNDPSDRIQFIQGELSEIPSTEQFDVIVSLAVIEHVADPIAFVQALSEKCKDGGVIIVMTVASESLMYFAARKAYKMGVVAPAKRLYSSHHLQHFTKKSLEIVLKKAQLKVVKKFFHAPPFKAIDVPLLGKTKRLVFYIGLISCYCLQVILRKQYLQTQIAIKYKQKN